MRAATLVWNDRRSSLREIVGLGIHGAVEQAAFERLARGLERGLADGSLSPYRTAVWFEPFDDGRHGGVMHFGLSPAETEEVRGAAEHRRRLHEDAVAGAAALGIGTGASADEVAAAQAAVARRGAQPVATPADGLARLSEATAAVARAEAERLVVVVELVGATSTGSSTTERHKVDEVAIATSLSVAAAETLVARARLLHTSMACFGEALAAAEVSLGHCLALVSLCQNISDDAVLATIAERALPFARRMVVSDFRKQVVALIAELDPDAEARTRAAAAARTVYKRRDVDGMSFLGVLHRTPVINALFDRITRDGALLLDARRADHTAAEATDAGQEGVDPDAAARGLALDDGDLGPDACRADALVARMLGTVGEDGSVTWDPSDVQVTVEVVMDLDTLNGLADRLVLVDGEPMPAQVGRELAYVARWFRRVIVDPVDGHLLDYGDRAYLPDPVRRFCFARDRGCRAPNCTRVAPRFLQLDHADEYPGGPSSVANCGALCTRCHQQKTARLLDIEDSRADGTAAFTTPWGQRVRIPARPYLPRITPAPERPAPAPQAAEPTQPETPPF